MAKKITEKKTVNQILTEQIIEQLEKGVVAWRKTWAGGVTQPANWFTKRPYKSWMNLMIHAISGFENPYYATFADIKKNGGSLEKGSKATKMWSCFVAYSMNGKSVKIGDVPNHVKAMTVTMVNNTTQEHGYKARFVDRYISVFNMSLVKGIDCTYEVIESSNSNDIIEEAEKIINEMPSKPEYDFSNVNSPCYSPSQDVIKMPNLNDFTGSEEFYSTMFHEMAHSTGHQSRLNRKGITDPVKFGSDNYSKEELVAELTACFICNEIGLKPAVIENQTAYINSWIKVLKKDFDLIRHASIEAEKAYKFILDK